MSSNRSKEIHLANRPTGFPEDTNFIVKEVDLTDPNTNEVFCLLYTSPSPRD